MLNACYVVMPKLFIRSPIILLHCHLHTGMERDERNAKGVKKAMAAMQRGSAASTSRQAGQAGVVAGRQRGWAARRAPRPAAEARKEKGVVLFLSPSRFRCGAKVLQRAVLNNNNGRHSNA